MMLKRSAASPLAPLRPLRNRRWLTAFVLVCGLGLVVATTAVAGIYYGMVLYKLKVAASLADFVDDVVATRLQILPNFVAGNLGPGPERLYLHVNHENFQRLAYAREQALQRGILLTSPEDEVPARLDSSEGTADVKMRLKGDWADHLIGDKWSFRIKARGEHKVMGMEVFSLHHPRTRRYIYEWLFHQALRREELLHLRYEFVGLSLNGRDLGIYALEEHFDKRLIERNARREGPILAFNEDLHWRDIHATGRRGATSSTGLRGFRAGHVDAFRKKSLQKNPALWEQFMAAASLLEGFRAGDLTTSQVFDVAQLATYFALLDLLGAEHSASWINLRFYYNPITARLEPIGFDANAGARLRHVLGSSETQAKPGAAALRRFFADPLFFAAYVGALERVSQPAYLEALLADVREELERGLKILYREFPYVRFDQKLLERNQKTIRATLEPVESLQAYYDGTAPGSLRLELANLGALPVELLEVRHGDSRPAVPAIPTLLSPTPFTGGVAYQPVEFALPPSPDWEDIVPAALRVQYRLIGSHVPRVGAVLPWPRRLPGFSPEDVMRKSPNPEEFEFLSVDDATGSIHVAPGSWSVNRDLILPGGYRVHAGPGTRLDLVDSAVVVSSSPLEFEGSEEAPVVIESSDGSGQGLLVYGTPQQSRLEHVIFRGLRSPDRMGWKLTGAVTFYEAPVAISHCAFLKNASEDGLNIVRSDFSIEDSLFRETASDAFDADFSDGVVRNSVFIELGNDAVDVSGSTVTLADVRIQAAGDKAVSAGERATLTVRGLDVTKAELGVASKDDSSVSVSDLTLRDSRIGLAVFMKKTEFGPARMKVERSTLEGVGTAYLVETGSQLTVDGRSIEPNGADVKALLYSSG